LVKLPVGNLTLPFVPDWAEPVCHLFAIRTITREKLRKDMAKLGVEALIHYPIPPYLQPAYSELDFVSRDFSLTDAIHKEILSLPIGPHLNYSDVDMVIKCCS